MAEKTLKAEYNRRKTETKARELQEAKELLESSVLIVEKLNTATIGRIVDAMNGVEEAIGPVLVKLPSLQKALDAAEAELSALIAGKGGNDPRKTSVMLGKAMAFYQGLSEFLRDDLPVLLKSRMLAQAKAKPDAPVGPGMAGAFKQALAINKAGGFIKRLFSSTNVPYVNNDALSKELTTLSFNELQKLTMVGRMPVVLPQAQIDQAAQAAVTPTPGAPAPQAATPAQPPTGGSGLNLQSVMDRLGGPQGLINFLQKNQLDKVDSTTVTKALQAVMGAKPSGTP